MDNGLNEKITEKRSCFQIIRDGYRLIEMNSFKALFFPFILVWVFYAGHVVLSKYASYDSQLICAAFCIAFLSYLVIGIAINLMQKREHWFYRDTMTLIKTFFKPMMLVGSILFIAALYGIGQNINMKFADFTIGRCLGIVLLFCCVYLYSLLIYREQGNISTLKSFPEYFKLLAKNVISFIQITAIIVLLIPFVLGINYYVPFVVNGKTWFDFLFHPELFCSADSCPSPTGFFVNSFLFFYIYLLFLVAMASLWEANRPAEETPELDSEEEIKADLRNKVNQAIFGKEQDEE